ncbi:MAG: hypothetical protein ACRC6O_08660 [Flavobacterium sp.]
MARFVEKEVRYTDALFPASWVDKEDWIVLELCTSLYTDPIQEKDGWEMMDKTESVAVWTRGDDAVVGIMGTSPKTGISNILDDAALAGIVDNSCDLSVVNQASALINNLQGKNIIVGGHSLGGAAAFCIAHKHPVKRAVAFNGGAPPTGGGLKGTGENCRFYHIVGDIISTHVNDSTARVTRIHLKGDVNWTNTPYYHSTERFFENRSYEVWHAQEEQNSVVNYVYNQSPTVFFLTLLTGLISKELNKDRIREIVCKNPIPTTSANCPQIYNSGRNVLGLAGGLVGGFFGGPVGAAAGAKLGYDIGGGSGLLDILAPNSVETIKQGLKRGLQAGQAVNRTVSKRVRYR